MPRVGLLWRAVPRKTRGGKCAAGHHSAAAPEGAEPRAARSAQPGKAALPRSVSAPGGTEGEREGADASGGAARRGSEGLPRRAARPGLRGGFLAGGWGREGGGDSGPGGDGWGTGGGAGRDARRSRRRGEERRWKVPRPRRGGAG